MLEKDIRTFGANEEVENDQFNACSQQDIIWCGLFVNFQVSKYIVSVDIL